jgi:hypothetical protein
MAKGVYENTFVRVMIMLFYWAADMTKKVTEE